MKKWFISFMAAFVVITAIAGIGRTTEVMAATQERMKGSSGETGTTSDGFSYKILARDGTVEITKYNGKKKKLVFPDKINGRKVTEIGEKAVAGNKYVVSVKVPDSVKKVALHAFDDCQNLTTIKLGKNVTQIVEEDCHAYDEGMMDVREKFKAFEVDDDNKVYYSEDGVLFKLEKDGERVLLMCPPAKTGDYRIPDGTTSTDLLAFYGSQLSTVTFPATVKEIGGPGYNYRGNYRSGIEEYRVDEENEDYCAKDGVLFAKSEKGELLLLHYPKEKKDTSYTVPDGVSHIDIFALYGNEYLEEVTMPDTVLYIREGAFQFCENLKSAVISGNIGDKAFLGCESLVDVELKDTVYGISENAFDLSGLESIILPESVEILGVGALGDSLKKVEIRNRECEIEEGLGYANITVIYGYADSTAEAYAKKYGYRFKLIGEEEKPGEGLSEGTINRDTVQLSKTSYTYNGKAKKPEVIVRDKFGNKIKKGDYRVSYKNNKNVGIATVKIQLLRPYDGTIKTTFVIKPPKSSITKLTATENGFRMQWKGVKASQIDGYEIQYSASKKFEADSTKKIRINRNNAVKKNIKKLKAGETYYVRIRSYKIAAKDGKTERLYSEWSDRKKVKTL